MDNTPFTAIANYYLGHAGAMVASSKGRAHYEHPERLYIFNANVSYQDLDLTKRKIWWGDLNLSDIYTVEALSGLAKHLKRSILVDHEVGAKMKDNSYAVKFTSTGDVILGTVKEHFDVQIDGTIIAKDAEKLQNKLDKEEIIKEGYIKNEKIKVTVDIELPDMIRFGSLDEDLSPYVKFYEFVAKKLGLTLKDIDVDKVTVTSNTAEELNVQLLEWLQLVFEGDEYSIQKNYNWSNFIYGPKVNNHEDIKDGHVYIS